MSNDIYTQKLQDIFKNITPTIKRIKKLDKELYEWVLTQYPIHNNISAKVYCIIHNEDGICHCGNKKNFNRPDRGFHNYCSIKCSSISKEVKNKRKRTNLKKYGFENPAQTKEIKEKQKQTCLKQYGVSNPLKLKIIQEKIKQTNIEKYGVKWARQIHQTSNVRKILDSKEKFNKFMKDKTVKVASDILNINSTTILNYIKKYNTQYLKTRSSFELEMEKFLKENKIHFQQNTRLQISPYELDFYLPEYSLAIECNGDYWHSKHPEGYHSSKYNLCKKKGIKLLHIWEILWNENRDEMEKFILENFS